MLAKLLFVLELLNSLAEVQGVNDMEVDATPLNVTLLWNDQANNVETQEDKNGTTKADLYVTVGSKVYLLKGYSNIKGPRDCTYYVEGDGQFRENDYNSEAERAYRRTVDTLEVSAKLPSGGYVMVTNVRGRALIRSNGRCYKVQKANTVAVSPAAPKFFRKMLKPLYWITRGGQNRNNSERNS